MAADSAETFRMEGDKVSLQFPNNSISDILGIYERLTSKTLIKDTSIFEGQTISLVTPEPVEKAEAIKLIEAAMLTNGYAIVADKDGKSARILPMRTQGASSVQFSQGVNFYQSAMDIPSNETIVSYFMPLDYLDPTVASQTLGNHVGLSVYGRITAVTTPPGLLITETANIVKQLIGIKTVIDQPAKASSLITKFIKLKYADANTVAQIVQSTIDAQASDKEEKGITTVRGQSGGGGGGGGQPGGGGGAPSGGPPGSTGGSPGGPPGSSGGGSNASRPTASVSPGQNQVSTQKTTETKKASAQVVADTRLNQVLVVAEPEEYTYIISLIAEFDQVVIVEDAYERKLKNVYSADIITVLADVLQETSTAATTQLPGGGSLTQSQQQLQSTSSSQVTGRSSSQNARGGSFTNSSGGSSGGSTSTSGVTSTADQLIESEEDNAPIGVTVGNTRIIADPLNNSIIVIGSKEDKDKVDGLITMLDRKSPQVYLATVIGQLTLTDGLQFGIDYLQKFTSTGANSGLTSALIATKEDIITNNNVSDMTTNLITSSIANSKGFNIYGQIGDSVDAFVTALETSSKFKVLSRPSVFALNNKKAVITSGQSIPVPTQSLTNSSSSTGSDNGNVTTTIEYKDVVLKLEVIPLINPDGEVTLKIAQVNDTVVGYQTVSENEIPIIGTEQLITTVTVPNGNTVVLGGLISESDKKDTEGIPYISRIPLLGNLFKETVTSKDRKELIIFIQPVVVGSDSALRQASMSEDFRTSIGADAARVFPEKVIPKAEATELKLPEKKKNFFQKLFKKKEPVPAATTTIKTTTTTKQVNK